MKKVTWIVQFLFCACLLLMGTGAQGRSPRANTELKLMSFNIRFATSKDDKGVYSWEARKAPVIAMMNDVCPDVVGLQEQTPIAMQYLMEKLPRYSVYNPDVEEGLVYKRGHSQVILWVSDKYELLDKGRFWISETPEVRSKGWDSNSIRTTTWVKLKDLSSGKEFFVFNTHIDHKGPIAKQEGVKFNVAKMKEIAGEDATVFICGDMNIQRHKKNGYYLDPYYEWMYSAREMAVTGCDRPSFNGFEYEGKKPGWLDHIFYRAPKIKARKYEVIDSEDYGVKYISDHYPIVATFKF